MREESFKVDLCSDGTLDATATAFVREHVERVIEAMEVPTIKGLSELLEIHAQRASRLVHALGLRDRFKTQGRPAK